MKNSKEAMIIMIKTIAVITDIYIYIYIYIYIIKENFSRNKRKEIQKKKKKEKEKYSKNKTLVTHYFLPTIHKPNKTK